MSKNNFIKVARQRKGISKEDLAKELNVSISWVTMVEQGKRNIKTKYLLKLSKLLDIEVEDIIKNETYNIKYDCSKLLKGDKDLLYFEKENQKNIEQLKEMKKKYLKIIENIDISISLLELKKVKND